MSYDPRDDEPTKKPQRCQCSGDMPGHCPGPANCPMCETDEEMKIFEVRIAGPDDVIVFSDELEAHQRANEINKMYLQDRLKNPDEEVLCVATVHERNDR